MYIYFCTNCSNLEAYNDIDGKHVCPECGKTITSLNYDIKDWNLLTNEQMLGAIEEAKNNAKIYIKKPDFSVLAKPDESGKNSQGIFADISDEEKPALLKVLEGSYSDFDNPYYVIGKAVVVLFATFSVISFIIKRVLGKR